jgi:membrane protease YdiL (CAAX protease family)
VFGLAHAYQGATGILVTGVLGLVFGLLYLRSKSLWPLVIAHGLIDTLSLVALYAGKLPAQ